MDILRRCGNNEECFVVSVEYTDKENCVRTGFLTCYYNTLSHQCEKGVSADTKNEMLALFYQGLNFAEHIKWVRKYCPCVKKINISKARVKSSENGEKEIEILQKTVEECVAFSRGI